jgi:hypothetical protein
MSKQNDEIDRVSDKMKAWQDCYNNSVKHLNDVSPLDQLIPADIAKLMNKDEMERAKAHLEQVQANVNEDARVSSRLVLADFAVWRSATEAYVNEHNEMVKKLPPADIEARSR